MAATHTLRQAETRDLPDLGRLGGSLVRLHHAFDQRRFMAPRGDVEDGYGWFLGTQLDEKDMVVLVAEVDGQVVGYVYAGLEPMSWKELREPAGFIHDVVVDEAARGRGIATDLVEAASRWLIEHGAPRVMLWTASENPAAQRLFKRLGFRTTMLEMTREAGQR